MKDNDTMETEQANTEIDRTATLKDAQQAVNGRDGSHGEPEDNFGRIATMWSVYLGIEVEPYQVADLMALLKYCRISSGHPDHDHHVDVCGYGTLGGYLASKEGQE